MRLLLPFACALSLTACVSAPTVYGPAGGSDRGYSQQQIESDRFRVSFAAGSDLDYGRTEDLALRRAAELTLEQGGDWFLVVARLRDGDDRDPVRVGGSVSRTIGSRGYSGSSVGLGVSIDGSAGEKSVTLEILVRTGEPEAGPEAYDARDVLARVAY
ncbi:hypothetical protein [Maricaulis sp.]|uniref:CC0125/CC1285 family lipoprotein n=1 Tax=Maricaulis sp. TaxID=1486257 RepID=UPI0026172237|nr:hypothetical protein [Maricaulis sp.]